MKKEAYKPKGAYWWLVKFGLLYFSIFLFLLHLISSTYIDYMYKTRGNMSLSDLLLHNFKRMLSVEIIVLCLIAGVFIGFIFFFLNDYLILKVLKRHLTLREKQANETNKM